MKKLVVITLLVALSLITVMPALAARGPQAGPVSRMSADQIAFTAAGTISSLDGAAQTVTFQVVTGSPAVKPLIGQDLTVQTDAATRFLLITSSGTVAVSFADLAVGQKISVQGYAGEGTWTAQRITIGAHLIHQP